MGMTSRYASLAAWLAMVVSGAVSAEPLATVPVQYREVAQTYTAEGVVEAVRQSTVSAQISGRVKQVLFDVGDTVNLRTRRSKRRISTSRNYPAMRRVPCGNRTRLSRLEA